MAWGFVGWGAVRSVPSCGLYFSLEDILKLCVEWMMIGIVILTLQSLSQSPHVLIYSVYTIPIPDLKEASASHHASKNTLVCLPRSSSRGPASLIKTG